MSEPNSDSERRSEDAPHVPPRDEDAIAAGTTPARQTPVTPNQLTQAAESNSTHENPTFTTNDLSDRRLGGFRLLHRLGLGGMAEVYLAEQTSIDRRVALKILRPELVTDETHLKRFAQEARAAGGLNHPNIVQVYTIGEEQGIHYIAQEYVHGFNLAQFLKRNGPPDLNVALQIMQQSAQALKAAGEAGIVHRDIKPENILITRKGEVKIADFGLARLSMDERVDLTQDGMTMGTPLYMSPEQINGHQLDVRSDIYSFGVTCYHLLAGRPPFRGETVMSLAVQHVNQNPQPLEEIRPDLPPPLCRMIDRMLAKSPQDRYSDAAALLNDLDPLSRFAGEEQTDEALFRLGKIVARGNSPSKTLAVSLRKLSTGSPLTKAMTLALGCLIVALLAAGIGWWMRPAHPLAGEARVANSERKEPTAIDQYFRAMALDTEQAWLAVLQNYPDETQYVQPARAQLARFYLQSDRLDEAAEQFSQCVDENGGDEELRAQGYAGLAVIAALKGDHRESHRILTQVLLPLHGFLDETTRRLVHETIDQNRRALDGEVPADLEERFGPVTAPGTQFGGNGR